jgi:hypothetical protein
MSANISLTVASNPESSFLRQAEIGSFDCSSSRETASERTTLHTATDRRVSPTYRCLQAAAASMTPHGDVEESDTMPLLRSTFMLPAHYAASCPAHKQGDWNQPQNPLHGQSFAGSVVAGRDPSGGCRLPSIHVLLQMPEKSFSMLDSSRNSDGICFPGPPSTVRQTLPDHNGGVDMR